MNLLPVVVRAARRGRSSVRLLFNDGVEGVVELDDLLTGPIYQALKDPAYFGRFHLEGGTLTWPNGAGISPETLHARARQTL